MTGKCGLAGDVWIVPFTCLDTVSRYGQSLPCLFCELSLEGAYKGWSSSSSSSYSSTFAFLLEASEGCPFVIPFWLSSTERFMKLYNARYVNLSCYSLSKWAALADLKVERRIS